MLIKLNDPPVGGSKVDGARPWKQPDADYGGSRYQREFADRIAVAVGHEHSSSVCALENLTHGPQAGGDYLKVGVSGNVDLGA